MHIPWKEELLPGTYSVNYRTRVIGGWLITQIIREYSNTQMSAAICSVFVPDEQHIWKI